MGFDRIWVVVGGGGPSGADFSARRIFAGERSFLHRIVRRLFLFFFSIYQTVGRFISDRHRIPFPFVLLLLVFGTSNTRPFTRRRTRRSFFCFSCYLGSKQFVSNQFSDVVGSTVHPHRYATSLVLSNNRIIEIHISDFPAIETFPEDSLQEWNLHCSASSPKQQQQNARTQKPPQSFCRLRQASAYVLVFDSSRPAPTFQYIRQIRDQILSHGGKDVYKKPMVVAANKQDLIHMARGPSSVGGATTTATLSWSNRGPLMGKGRRRGNKYVHHQHHSSSGANGSHNSNGLGNSGGNGGGKNGHNGTTGTSSEWSCTVRKQWRCLYVECSAKFNWQVVHLFQQVVNAIESCSMDGHRHQSGGDPSRHQLPHSIAQLVHLGQLAHLGGFINVPGAPPVVMPLPPPPRPLATSPETRRRTTTTTNGRSTRRIQCPVC